MALLEPTEPGCGPPLGTRQIPTSRSAAQLGLPDKRTISRVNGQIYVAWELSQTTTDEKVPAPARRSSPAPASSSVGRGRHRLHPGDREEWGMDSHLGPIVPA